MKWDFSAFTYINLFEMNVCAPIRICLNWNSIEELTRMKCNIATVCAYKLFRNDIFDQHTDENIVVRAVACFQNNKKIEFHLFCVVEIDEGTILILVF